MTRAAVAIAIMLSGLAVPALALDQVQRCGSSYSFEPCAAGGPSVDVADQRTAQQVSQAHEVAQRDARLADALARERLQAERAKALQGPAAIGPARPTAVRPACRAGSDCERSSRVQRRHDRTERVTLYRAPGNN